MIRYAKQNSDLILQFNTNANRMTPDISRELVNSGLDKLTISLDGVTKETYEKVRCGSNFERVIGNVNALLEAKKAAGAALPLVTLQIIRMDITADEIDAFVETWQDRVDYVSVTNIGATTADSQVLSHSLREEKRKSLRPCRQIWQRLSVLWDGTVTVCCNDFDGFLAVGKVGETSLRELWHGEKLSNLRARHKKCRFENLICDSCSDVVTYGG
jgi:MoaA/NifB/PqqE/SkfB family radical SAM enzyme